MTPKDAVAKLVSAGHNHSEIARQLSAAGVQATQPTVYRIGSGEIQNPGFAIGNALVALCERLVPAKPKKRKAA